MLCYDRERQTGPRHPEAVQGGNPCLLQLTTARPLRPQAPRHGSRMACRALARRPALALIQQCRHVDRLPLFVRIFLLRRTSATVGEDAGKLRDHFLNSGWEKESSGSTVDGFRRVESCIIISTLHYPQLKKT